MPQHHDESRAEPLGGELDAADLRRGDDVAGDTDDKKVTKALIEDVLRRHPRIGASENDGERLLTRRQLATASLAGESVALTSVGHESMVSLTQAFECFRR